jgi:hypothetical protein
VAAPVVREEDLRDPGSDPEADDEAEAERLLVLLDRPPERRDSMGARVGTPLAQVRTELDAWLVLATGRRWTLGVADPPTTDTRGLYLPAAMPLAAGAGPLAGPATPRPSDDVVDRARYRCLAILQAERVTCGLLEGRALLAELHADVVLRSCYHALTTRWVDRRLRARLPGLTPDLDALRADPRFADSWQLASRVPAHEVPGAWRALFAPVPDGDGPAARAARAVDALPIDPHPLRAAALLGLATTLRTEARARRLDPPPVPAWAGVLRPDWVLTDLARDPAAEEAWRHGPAPLRQLLAAMARGGTGNVAGDVTRDFAPQGLRARLASRLRGPPEGATPAYAPQRAAPAAAPEPPTPVDIAAVRWPEWRGGAWVHDAVEVVPRDAPMGPLERHARIVAANGPAIARVRANFAALRPETRWLHRQHDGSELDLAQVVDARTDLAAGRTPDARLHARFERARSTVATMVLADLSGSTAGAVMAAQQEALVLLAEGLAAWGAPHAMHGFGNPSPAVCPLWRIKDFDDPWDDAARARLGNLSPQGASRLGAILRHAGWMLSRRAADRRVLLLISDGRPEDRDGYRGPDGLQDTALAVGELRARGVHVHCASLDARDDSARVLDRTFGPSRWVRVRRPEDLPARLPELLRALVR